MFTRVVGSFTRWFLIRSEQRGLCNVFCGGMMGIENDDGSGGVGSSGYGGVGWVEAVVVALALPVVVA